MIIQLLDNLVQSINIKLLNNRNNEKKIVIIKKQKNFYMNFIFFSVNIKNFINYCAISIYYITQDKKIKIRIFAPTL